ncbi:transglycosylase domain-containing protein, partial [Nonomuraea sp. NPDC050663]|uniref:transglycosylase domain-containing protein n=1 Tax=Nonomuraea sp. NPDC050663 TaxID=3364370 RepID=UPI0037B80F81
GISFSGLARSVWMTATGQQIQGASTITQQMARGYYEGIGTEVSPSRKIKEIFVAVKLNKSKPKEWILWQYLNTIYFGRGASGVEAAAKAYFGKPAKELTVPESAYLAGRIQNPSRFDEAEAKGNMALTKERFNYVIGGLQTIEAAEYGQYKDAKFEDLKFKDFKPKEAYTGLKGYMLNIVERELESKYGISEEALRSRGLKVVTTFDQKLMLEAKRVVDERTRTFGPAVHATVASVNPKNGRVVAFFSGDDYTKNYTNRAFDTVKQAASAFKPYVLAAWLEQGWSLDSYIEGMKTIKAEGTTPISNAGGQDFGSINLSKATASSVNTVFVQMGQKVGLEKIAEIAKAAGVGERATVTQGQNGVDRAIEHHKYATTIGSASVTAVEQAAGYSIFANGGKYTPWHTVISITTFDKTKVGEESKASRTVLTEGVAADATYALQQVVKAGTGGAANIGRPVAGKTGTNNESKDAWFVGFTPQLSTAVGMYKEMPFTTNCKKELKYDKYGNPLIHKKNPEYQVCWREVSLPGSIGGGGLPTQIWHDFMAAAMDGRKVEDFPVKAGTGVPNNLAPKPEPKPEKTEDPFGDDGSMDNCVLGICTEDDGVPEYGDGGDGGEFDEGGGDATNEDPSTMGGQTVPSPPAGAASVPESTREDE